jgi:hypothetical protein
LLSAHRVEYLLIGGHAVGYHGYPRATADMDVWIGVRPDNAERMVGVLHEFGFTDPAVQPDLFLEEDRIVRIGMPPLRIEIATTISGVAFTECYADRVVDNLDGVEVSLISLRHLRANKQASGRHKDLGDLENLPE